MDYNVNPVLDIRRLTLALLILVTVASAERSSTGLDEDRAINASQVLAQIEMGKPVNLSDVIVQGNLDLSKINLPTAKVVSSPIKVENSLIYGAVDFSDAILDEQTSFKKTKFFGPASFFHTHFNKDVDFSEAQFNKTASFKQAQFNASADYERSRFDEFADFSGACFREGTVNFEGSEFKGVVYFWETLFDVESVNFGWCQFWRPIKLWRTQFSGSAIFQGSQFKDAVDLTRAQFDADVDFTGAKFDKELYLIDVKFSKLEINWPSIKDKLVCNGPTYLALIKNFKELEQFEDSDSCYYQYRNWKRDQRELGWSKFFDYLAWISCGYGVRWQHTVIFGALIMIFFGMCFELNSLLAMASQKINKKSSPIQGGYNLIRRVKKSLSFSAMILLSLPSDWYPYGKEDYTESVRSHLYSAIFERLIGWGLMLLLIGTLTRLMVRY
jgi:hypothetical protein